jgi:hypothetical protein
LQEFKEKRNEGALERSVCCLLTEMHGTRRPPSAERLTPDRLIPDPLLELLQLLELLELLFCYLLFANELSAN